MTVAPASVLRRVARLSIERAHQLCQLVSGVTVRLRSAMEIRCLEAARRLRRQSARGGSRERIEC